MTVTRRKNESALDYAARLVVEERENLIDSAPIGTLRRMDAVVRELRSIEDSL